MPPHSAAESVLVVAEAGLGNKLRVVLSYLDVARRRGQKLVVFWRLSPECDATFDELYEPLDGVRFLHALPPNLPTAPRGAYDTHPELQISERESAMYAQLRPRPSISARVAARLKAFGGAEFCAIHVRRTDHAELFGERSPCRDVDFYAFCDRHDPLPIFLATDNAATQAAFAARYGARLRALTPMRPRRSKRHAPGADTAGADAAGARHTSVADAVADLEACVMAKVFKGTELSSFSDAVAHLRRARGVAHDGDSHRIRKLGGKFPDDTDYSVPFRDVQT